MTLLLTLLCAQTAQAQVQVYPPAGSPQAERVVFDDDDGEPPVVTNRARPFSGNLELTLMFTPSVIEKYLNHLGGFAGLSYHVNNWFAIEALGGYEYMREAAIIGGDAGVRARIGGTREPRLPGLLGMSWVALAGVTLAPIYGKLNVFSEVDFNSQVYFILGAGAVGAVKRELFDPGSAENATFTIAVNRGPKLAFDAGFGLRLFLVKWMALRVELRDIIYWDYADILQNGTSEIDVVNNFMGCFGVSFIVN